jgi:ABC-type nitrate/sulfonate/bicarbonate transport system ATPase subunit
METLIKVRGLSKTYGEERILEAVDLDLLKGEILVVLGESGAGKTTLLRILSGLEEDYEGHLEYDDEVFSGTQVPLPVVFQDFDQLLPWYTVEGNILLPYKRKVLNKKDLEIVEFLGLTAHLKKYPNELSGGMKQRVAIGRSLLSDGKIIFMDEPFGSLDVKRRSQLQALIIEINKKFGRSILFITHDLQEAKFLAHRVAIVKEGKLLITDKNSL